MQGVENLIEYCDEYLEKKWQEINDIAENAPHDFLDDSYKKLKSQIVDCLKSSIKSYHYVLPTQLLSKAVEHSLDCRSLQASYEKPGAFDARSIAHKVIVPFDKRNYNVLGGSTEPYVNNPLRCSSVTRENKQRQKNKKDWEKLIEILDFVERKDDVDLTLTQLESKLNAARARKIKEILFIAQRGVEERKATAIGDKVKGEFSSGQNIYITTLIEFASSILILLGEKGRVNLLHRVGQELDRVNATISHRKAWAKLLRES